MLPIAEPPCCAIHNYNKLCAIFTQTKWFIQDSIIFSDKFHYS